MFKGILLGALVASCLVSQAAAQSSVLPYWINSSNIKVPTGTGNPLPVTIVGGGGGGLSVTDQAAWTQGSSSMTPVGCAFNDTATLTSGQQGTIRCNTKRASIFDVDTTGNNLYAALTAAIPAGTNLIGDVNLRQGGAALSTTNGIYSNLLQGNAVISATNGLFANQLQGNAVLSATNGTFANVLQGNAVLSATNPSFAAPIPTTAGGLTVETFQPTASTNSANIKASAGQVYKIDAFNNSATVHYIRLYNSATTGTCNSATNLIWQGIIPASTSGAGLSSSWDLGIPFSSGIARCVTSGYDGTGNATASAIITNIGYK